MLRLVSGDHPPPVGCFVAHVGVALVSDWAPVVAAAESAVSRAGDAVTDMAYFCARDEQPALCAKRRCGPRTCMCSSPDSVTAHRSGTVQRCLIPELEYQTAGEAGIPRLIFLLGEDAEGPAGLFRDPRFGDRQEGFRDRLLTANRVAATVTSPDGLEAALLHALHVLPRARSAGMPAAWTGRKITAWPSVVRNDPADPGSPPAWGATIRNGSELPIYQVHVEFVRSRAEGAWRW